MPLGWAVRHVFAKVLFRGSTAEGPRSDLQLALNSRKALSAPLSGTASLEQSALQQNDNSLPEGYDMGDKREDRAYCTA